MTSCIKLEVHTDDRTPHKWIVALGEDVFRRFLSQGNPAVHKAFGDGSLFSPLLFGKFFDPSDAFPLWEFESDVLLSHLQSTGQSSVDWLQTDQAYVLKAELPGKCLSTFSFPPVFKLYTVTWNRRNLRSCFCYGFKNQKQVKHWFCTL